MYPQTGFPQALGYILVFLLREILGTWLVLQVQLGPFALLLENRLLLLCSFYRETYNVFLDSSNAECCPDRCSIPFFLEWTISHHLHCCFQVPTSFPSHCATEVAPLLSPLTQSVFIHQADPPSQSMHQACGFQGSPSFCPQDNSGFSPT